MYFLSAKAYVCSFEQDQVREKEDKLINLSLKFDMSCTSIECALNVSIYLRDQDKEHQGWR